MFLALAVALAAPTKLEAAFEPPNQLVTSWNLPLGRIDDPATGATLVLDLVFVEPPTGKLGGISVEFDGASVMIDRDEIGSLIAALVKVAGSRLSARYHTRGELLVLHDSEPDGVMTRLRVGKSEVVLTPATLPTLAALLATGERRIATSLGE